MTKTRLFIFFVLCSLCFTLSAQVLMRDVFIQMPDEMLPLVTRNNRLDCVDFIENGMQAKVKNRMDEYIELKQLTKDYLLLQTSEVGQVEMKLLSTSDSTAVICMVETVKGPLADSYVSFYTQDWQPTHAYDAQVQRPAVEAFFPVVADEHRLKVEDALAQLHDLALIEARLSADDNSITWTLALDLLTKDIKSVARECVKPVRSVLVP